MWLSGLITVVFFCAVGVQAQKYGETLNKTSDTLSSVSYPYPSPTPRLYVWDFEVAETNSLFAYLIFDTVDLSENDEVVIFDGEKNITYKGSKFPQEQLFVVRAKGSKVTVNLTDKTSVGKRFQFYYTAKNESENVFYYSDDYMGVIKSPLYSGQNNIAKVSWVITQKPGRPIYLAFKAFNISTGNLSIDDGTVHNLTGSELPSDMTTSTSNVRLDLELSLGNPNQSFILFYSHLYPNCSHEIILKNKTEETLQFSEIDNDLPVQCFTIVEGPENSVLSAAVNWDDNYNEKPSSNVLIELSDGGSRFSPSLLADSPNNRQPASNVVTKTNKLWIGYAYTTISHAVNATVNIFVHNQGESLLKAGSFGVKQSAVNATLPSNTSTYILNVQPNHQIVTNLWPNTTLLGENRILFYDGGRPDRLITAFTSNESFYPVISTKNQMLIVAENFEQKDMFEASFTSAPKDYNQLTTTKFGSYQVNAIEANSTRSWVVAPHLNSSEILVFTIATAELSPNLNMTVYKGPTIESTMVYQITNSSLKSSVFHISSETGALITFHDEGNGTAGLIADLSFKIQPAWNYTLDLNESRSAVIRSPDYPNVYPSNANCEWHIISKNLTAFTFKSLNLPATHPISIFSVNNSEVKLITSISGDTPVDILISEAHILVNWSSVGAPDSLAVAKGFFEIEVYSLDCGGNNSAKEFTTPGYPASLKNSTLCIWYIDIPPKQDDKVEVVQLTYSSIPVKSSLAQLTIYEGGSLQSVVASNVSAGSATNYLSRTNKLVIKYNYTEDATGGTPYTFNYNLYPCNNVCANGICLHDAWRCNGINECGDFTDEKDCGIAPIIQESSGVSVTSLVVAILLCLTLGAVGAIAFPLVWRRIRSHGRNYQEFRNSADA